MIRDFFIFEINQNNSIMLKVFITVLLVLPFHSTAAELIYSKTIMASGRSADQIHNQINLWIAENYVSSKDVVQFNDSEDHIVLIKALIIYESNITYNRAAANGVIEYSLKFTIIENQFQIEIYNFNHRGDKAYPQAPRINFGQITTDDLCPYEIKNTTKKWRNKVWNDIQIQIKEYSTNLFENVRLIFN